MSDVLSVNPIRCRAHGLCAELLPERVTLDDWGYPVVDGEPISPELHALAKRAVSACPVLALALEPAAGPGRAVGPRRRQALRTR